MNSEDKKYLAEINNRAQDYAKNSELKKSSEDFFFKSVENKYSYNFTWLGRPIVQYPQDIIAMQEIIWDIQPDLIIETGIARGGSLIFYASMLELIDNNGKVLGVDIDIRDHNREGIESHKLSHRIDMIQGSSISQETIKKVQEIAKGFKKILVILDSNHTYQHVKEELTLYSELIKKGSYVVVFDTIINDLSVETNGTRPWGPDDNPMVAVHEFLEQNDRFRINENIQNKLLFTVAKNGYLECIKD